MATIPRGYRGLDDFAAWASRHGARSLGSSVRGRPILAIARGEGDRVALVIAGLHAIEWIGVETAIAIAERAGGARDRRVIVVPIVNVDGYADVEADLRAGRRRFRRGNARGVDLNRNWPTGWRAARTPMPPSFLTHGTGPASEPEVAAILAALDGERAAGRTIDVAISLHSFGRKLLVPWGARWARPARDRELRVLADLVRARAALGEPYTIDQASRWVPGSFLPGLELDHLHATYGARSLLVECSRGGFAARDPSTWLAPFRWYNPDDPRAIAANLAHALAPLVDGAV